MASEPESIGGIKVTKMIWTATVLSLGTIYYCRFSCGIQDPSIMDSAMKYPQMVYMRMGVLYSLFILFLVNIFIKWWIDSSQMAKKSKTISRCGTIGIISYALFISTIDRARINYNLAEWAVFIAFIMNFFALTTIYKNLWRIHQEKPYFVGYLSWKLKSLFFVIYAIANVYGALIYFGFADINDKNIMEYVTVTSTYLFYWTFIFDFKGYEMDILNFVTLNQFSQNEINREDGDKQVNIETDNRRNQVIYKRMQAYA